MIQKLHTQLQTIPDRQPTEVTAASGRTGS